MIRDRFITILEYENLSIKKLEEMTGIDRYIWGNLKSQKQRMNEDHIEKITEIFPEYSYWLVTGKELPESKQISPMTKKAQQELNQVGKAG